MTYQSANEKAVFLNLRRYNAASSVLEPDNLRFDVLRNAADPTKFLLVEVYAAAEGPAALAAGREGSSCELAALAVGARALLLASPPCDDDDDAASCDPGPAATSPAPPLGVGGCCPAAHSGSASP